MTTVHLDHLVFGAASLGAGVDAFERRTGVRLPPGGEHPLMGTHNHVTRVADGTFVELIAIDPDAPAPPRPRWFSLDDAATAARLAAGPALLAWVVRVPDLDKALARARGAGVDAGHAVEQRRGDLRWRIAIRDDGALVANSAFPILIEWPAGVDAAARMADVGLRIAALRATHPEPARLVAALEAIGAASFVEVGEGEGGTSAVLTCGSRRETF